MLDAWDGVQPITKGLLASIKESLKAAGYGGERSAEALKW
jgi:hypothetical protein